MSRPSSSAARTPTTPGRVSITQLTTPRRLDSPALASAQMGINFANQLASRVTRRSSQAVALARKLVLSTKCPLCHADLAKRKKRFCRKCGGVFCENCTALRVRLDEYHSRFGVLRNHTAKMMHVCKSCHASLAPSSTLAPSPAAPSHKHVGEQQQQHGEHPHGEHHRGSIATRVQRVRATTLDRYMQSVHRAAKEAPASTTAPSVAAAASTTQHKRSSTLDGAAFAAAPADAAQISLERAKELRDQFFSGSALLTQPLADAANASAAADAAGDASAETGDAPPLARGLTKPELLPPAQRSWFEAFFSLFAPPPVTDLELDQALLDDAVSLEQMLASSEASLAQSRDALKESERQLEKSRLEQVKRLKAKLAETQAQRIASATEQGATVRRQLQAHAATLRVEIAHGRGVVPLPGEGAGVVDLRNELSVVQSYLHELELEAVFPRCMQTKLRIAVTADDGFAGVRDVDLEALDAAFELAVGPGPLVRFKVSGAVLNVALYGLEFRGGGTRMRVLSGLLPHSTVRICVTGAFELSLLFDEGGTADRPASAWSVRDAAFHLVVAKGSAGMLPEALLSYLTTNVIPGAVQALAVASLTGELGAFARAKGNAFTCAGELQVRGDVTPGVWAATLVGPTSASAAARRCAGLSDDEAAVVDFALRSTLAAAVGFAGGATSLSSLHQWRLQLAAVPLLQLGALLAVVEAGAKVALPEGGLLGLLERVDALAVKPVTLSLQLSELAVDVDLGDVLTLVADSHMRGVEEAVGRHLAPEATLLEARVARDKVQRAFREVLVPLLRPSALCNFGCMLAGGSGGILAVTLSDAQASLCLPHAWSASALLWESPELYDGFVLATKGKAGPGAGEYTLAFNVLPAGESPDDADEDDLEVCALGVRVDLFPPGAEPGSLRLHTQSLRSSLLLSAGLKLVEALLAAPSSTPAAGAAGRERMASLADTAVLAAKSRSVLESLWGSFREHDGGAPAAAAAAAAWTSFLTRDEAALHVDLRGFQLRLERVGEDAARIEVARARATRQDSGQASLTVRSSLQQLFSAV